MSGALNVGIPSPNRTLSLQNYRIAHATPGERGGLIGQACPASVDSIDRSMPSLASALCHFPS